ncbi:hypothetical protein Tco_0441415, partial [Tanacetum coccineum]
GLKASKNMDIDEQVAIFLHIIAHNVKNRVMICRFYRSGETISRYFSRVCNAVIRLHLYLLKKQQPIRGLYQPLMEMVQGALDGTYIKCLVPLEEKPRYRTRKGEIATNVLGWVREAKWLESSKTMLLFDMTSQKRNYRGWTSVEDEKLVEALLTMKNTSGYKADNGFKPGYDRAQGKRSRDAFEMEQEVNTEEQEQQSDNDLDEAVEGSLDQRSNVSAQVEESPSVPSKKKKNMRHGKSLMIAE